MALKRSKPITPGQRGHVRNIPTGLYKGDPYKPLTKTKKRISGRNNQGRISVRRRGGGHKKNYRIIDFKRNKYDVPGYVERIEYDPNRSAHIALVLYVDGERRYIIAPEKLSKGSQVISGSQVPIKPGNTMPLRNIPLGTMIHCVELKPKKGAQIARSAGTTVQLLAREGQYAILKMSSGEIRKVLLDCNASIGRVSNAQHTLRALGKAGITRRLGRRPRVRGVAMNPVDHPHGGGEGATAGGRHPVTHVGKPTKGYRTRKNKRTQKNIIRRRRK